MFDPLMSNLPDGMLACARMGKKKLGFIGKFRGGCRPQEQVVNSESAAGQRGREKLG